MVIFEGPGSARVESAFQGLSHVDLYKPAYLGTKLTFPQNDARSSIPLNAIALTCLISALLLLISLGSKMALSIVISFTINSFYGSYLISASILLYRRLAGHIKDSPQDYDTFNAEYLDGEDQKETWTWGPWRMPKIIGMLINVYACVWMIFVLFWSSWPTVTPVDATTFNYSIFITLFVILASGLYYAGWAKKSYIGAVREI